MSAGRSGVELHWNPAIGAVQQGRSEGLSGQFPGAIVEVIETELGGVKVLVPRRFDDPRGVFCETFSRRTLAEKGIAVDFVQDNHSISRPKWTLRGLHFQVPPFAQDKLVRVVRGAALDVVVDVRRSSPTFRRHVSVLLTAENWKQIFVPAGFAHGFVTIEPDTEVIYKVSSYYSAAHDRGVLWNDPDLRIEWGVAEGEAVLSEKDRKLPRLRDAKELF